MQRSATFFILIILLVASPQGHGVDSEPIYFSEIQDNSIYATIEHGDNGKEVIIVAGVPLIPNGQDYLRMIDEGFISAYPSPDHERLIVSLGHLEEKNVWVINLRTKTLEFTSYDNPARHVIPRWKSSEVFELIYGGMGYHIEREFRLHTGGVWEMVRSETFREDE